MTAIELNCRQFALDRIIIPTIHDLFVSPVVAHRLLRSAVLTETRAANPVGLGGAARQICRGQQRWHRPNAVRPYARVCGSYRHSRWHTRGQASVFEICVSCKGRTADPKYGGPRYTLNPESILQNPARMARESRVDWRSGGAWRRKLEIRKSRRVSIFDYRVSASSLPRREERTPCNDEHSLPRRRQRGRVWR